MKRVKIIIEDIPDDYAKPELIRYSIDQLKLTAVSDLESLTVNEPDKEYYRHEMLGYGKDYREHFYIIESQKKAFEELFHGFLHLDRVKLLQQILDDIWRYNLGTKEGINDYLRELLEKEVSLK